MSIWGAGAEENDDAADWLADLADEPTVVLLNEAFHEVLGLERDDYLEVTECANAVAAAHVVAQLFDAQSDFTLLDAQAMGELQAQRQKLAKGAQRSLIKRAMRCLVMTADATRSELSQLMNEDAQMGRDWSQRIAQLGLRLKLALEAIS